MPYIKASRRDLYNADISKLVETLHREMKGPGDLNYVISKLCVELTWDLGLQYNTINGIMGVLECVKQEYYRQVAAPYENKKMDLNGTL